MLSSFFSDKMIAHFPFTPTVDQKKAVKSLSKFYTEGTENSVFILKGYAGTGKTSLVASMVNVLKELKIRYVVMAPTGRAAKVLTSHIQEPCTTIHKKIYRKKNLTDVSGAFVMNYSKEKDTLFIVDEASMISGAMNEGSIFGSGVLLDDLIEYVNSGRNNKLIFLGDTAQLPPVNSTGTPALDSVSLEMYGKDVVEVSLHQVLRQAKESGILMNATTLRQHLRDQQFFTYPLLSVNKFSDINRISGETLIDTISELYDKDNIRNTIVISRSNKRVNRLNNGIREHIFHREETIVKGDLIMIVKNNYFWCEQVKEVDFIANGDIAKITHIKGFEQMHGFYFAEVTLELIDYNNITINTKILLDALQVESASLPFEKTKQLYESVSQDYLDIKNRKKRWEAIKKDPYFNALQVKFAYAITCHKAQGGEWRNVILDQGYLVQDMLDKGYFQWLYTAFTRATHRLYLLNFNKEFFGEE